jgi:hypothetical protein
MPFKSQFNHTGQIAVKAVMTKRGYIPGVPSTWGMNCEASNGSTTLAVRSPVILREGVRYVVQSSQIREIFNFVSSQGLVMVDLYYNQPILRTGDKNPV